MKLTENKEIEENGRVQTVSYASAGLLGRFHLLLSFLLTAALVNQVSLIPLNMGKLTLRGLERLHQDDPEKCGSI